MGRLTREQTPVPLVRGVLKHLNEAHRKVASSLVIVVWAYGSASMKPRSSGWSYCDEIV